MSQQLRVVVVCHFQMCIPGVNLDQFTSQQAAATRTTTKKVFWLVHFHIKPVMNHLICGCQNSLEK